MADPSDLLEDGIGFARSYCIRHGDPEATDVLGIRLGGSKVVFSVDDARLYGCSLSGFVPTDPERRRVLLSRILNRIMRQRARERCIAAAGETGDPAWSLDVHVLAMAMLVNAGVNPLLLECHETRRDGTPSALDRILSASPLSASFEIRAGRACMTSARMRAEDGLIIYEPETSGGPMCLFVPGMSISETACAALKGRPLSEVLSHPMLDPNDDVAVDCTVSRIVNDEGNLFIELADDRTTVAPPPAGIEPEWLRFAWNA